MSPLSRKKNFSQNEQKDRELKPFRIGFPETPPLGFADKIKEKGEIKERRLRLA
jgi:hypothetical protein